MGTSTPVTSPVSMKKRTNENSDIEKTGVISSSLFPKKEKVLTTVTVETSIETKASKASKSEQRTAPSISKSTTNTSKSAFSNKAESNKNVKFESPISLKRNIACPSPVSSTVSFTPSPAS